jgi:hypothetical protein
VIGVLSGSGQLHKLPLCVRLIRKLHDKPMTDVWEIMQLRANSADRRIGLASQEAPWRRAHRSNYVHDFLGLLAWDRKDWIIVSWRFSIRAGILTNRACLRLRQFLRHPRL